MGKRIETPQHNGKCGHCSTAVPLEATVCTGCGAHWGTAKRWDPQTIYEKGCGIFKAGVAILVSSLFAILYSFLFQSNELIFFLFFGIPAACLGALTIMKGMEYKWAANKAEFGWWR